MPEQSHYDVLQVDATADIDTIKRAYRKLMRLYHPDNFVADMTRLQKADNSAALSALQRKAEAAQQQAQRINAAYSVLTDSSKRADYDRQLSAQRMAAYQEEIQRERSRDPEYGRRTVKSRRHQHAALRQKRPEAVPWILLLVLILSVIVTFTLLSRAMTRTYSIVTTHVPKAPTAEGVITSGDLQATTNAQEATYIARTQTAGFPAATPLSATQYERAADRLFEFSAFVDAAEVYGRALTQNPHEARLYHKRGLAYAALFAKGDDEAADFALTDFQQALNLDDQFAPAYRELGLVNFALWQQSSDEATGQAAVDALEQYVLLTGDLDAQVWAALEAVRDATTAP